MKQALVDELKVAYADVTGFMLLKIDLPDTYENAIVNTEVTNQEKVTFEKRRIVAETKQKTENIVAGADAKRAPASLPAPTPTPSPGLTPAPSAGVGAGAGPNSDAGVGR